jgi:hypothetical protein
VGNITHVITLVKLYILLYFILHVYTEKLISKESSYLLSLYMYVNYSLRYLSHITETNSHLNPKTLLVNETEIFCDS